MAKFVGGKPTEKRKKKRRNTEQTIVEKQFKKERKKSQNIDIGDYTPVQVGGKTERKKKRKSEKQIALETQYKKERRRIQQAVKRLEKRGYFFDETIVPEIPKRIRKGSIAKLEKITTKSLYGKARYVDVETGEILTGEERKKQEKQEATEKARKTRERKKQKTPTDYVPDISIVDSIEQAILRLPQASYSGYNQARYNEGDKANLISMLHDRLAVAETNGTGNEYVNYLMEVHSEIIEACDVITYSSGQEEIATQFVRIATLIKGGTLSMEESEDMTDFSEYYEDYEYE